MRLALAVLALAGGLPASAQAADDDLQIWSALTVSGAVAPRLTASIELNARLVDNADRLGVILVRPTIAYRASHKITVALGYTRQVQRNPVGSNVRENRIFQQLVWLPGKAGEYAFSTRLRLEQRSIEGADDTGWRARALARVQRPVSRQVAAFAQVEGFIALNDTDWGARSGFDQSRASAGVNIRVSPGLTVETGYLNRYLRRAGADRIDHVVPVILSLAL